MVDDSQFYVEEAFGVLTDDDVYLDCVLVKPAKLEDEDVCALRVWVPRYPLTKSSVITCARREAAANGPAGTVAHLVFDLRGTGHSEGQAGDTNFEMDIQGIRLWAEERFGKINVSFMGKPLGSEQVDVRPIRPGVVMETYHYRPDPAAEEPAGEKPPVIYLATYGNFGDADDNRCCDLAEAGYEVFAMDPLRYLLHASAHGRLKVSDLWRDLEALVEQMAGKPLLMGLPVSAGLALLWASGVEAAQGVVSIGRAQIAFKPTHIFANDNPHTFFLGRYVHRISPRPVSLVMQKGHPLGGDRDELSAIHQTCSEPRRLKQIEEITPGFLLEELAWLQAPG
ncbi:MAG: hypothetical protein R3248_07280 [Candidatus Promineifilaceae bacterium]|nr:hypothetical protein [Candidatus Promineifilaceae bacterium]